jgi:hypothetical protein
MSSTVASQTRSISLLVIFSGIAALLDTAIGAMASLGLDWSRTNEVIMGISSVLGFPMYLLDLWLKRRVAVCLVLLFVFRWVARCFGGATPVLCNPFVWPVGILLFLSLVLLQASRLRKDS